jgi:hypothetical protein
MWLLMANDSTDAGVVAAVEPALLLKNCNLAPRNSVSSITSYAYKGEGTR